jgi:CubicO group peptidase (beta-lactamase class C family)
MRILFLLISFLFSDSITAQTSSFNSLHPSQLKELVLLKNETNLVPIKQLDKIKIAHLSIGNLDNESVFGKTLQQYSHLARVHLSPTPTAAAVEKAKKQLNQQDLIILSVETLYEESSAKKLTELLSELHQNSSFLYVLFGAKEMIHSLPNIEMATAILYSPNANENNQSLAAQIIFGAAAAIGTLSEGIPPYQTGDGISTQGNLRLGFTTPELVGMESTYLNQEVAAIIQEGLDSMAFPGCQVLIARKGKVVYQKNFGYHTYAKEKAVQDADIYDLASVSKVTTAVPALMRLKDEGKFSLEAKLGDYFPDFKGSNKANLDFRSILAHNARLQPYIVYWQKAQKKNGKYKARTFKKKQSKRFPIKITDQLYLHKKFKRKIMRYIKKSPLNAKAGYVYSGLSFLMYPDFVKATTGKALDRYLYDTFYKPIGANNLVFNPIETIEQHKIIPTENDDFFRMQLVHGRVHDEAAAMLAGVSSNAGLFGNATDLAKLLQLYLNEGEYGGERFIEASTLQEFTRCQFCETDNRRGLGFDKPLIEYDEQKSYVAKSASPQSYGHSGFTGTFFWIDPKEELIVILLSNRVHPTRANRKLYTMGIRPRLQQAAYDAIYKFEEQK